MPENQATTPQQPVNQNEEKPAKVELDPETYAAMLDRLDELEAKNQPPEDEVDALAQQAQPQQQKPGRAVDLNRMTNEQLAQFVATELASDVINPMLVKLSQIELRIEEKELGETYKDFKEFKQDTYSLLHKNPSLSLEQAYLLAKQTKGPKAEDKTEGKERNSEKQEAPAKKDLLRHLPPRPAIHGEKPSGAAAGATRPAKPSDVRSAAERAIEDLEIEFPVKGGRI